MKLLVVDDEESAVLAVERGVRWERLPFDSILTARSMAAAQKIVAGDKVDVLLCDIEMPQGSGLELLSWMKDTHADTVCIFMTCHADFSYAQTALQLGSLDYILKPLDFEKLEKVLANAADQVQERRRAGQAAKYWEQGHKVAEKQFWRSLLIGDIPEDEAGIRNYQERNGLTIPMEAEFLPILVSSDMSSGEVVIEKKLYGFSFRNAAAEIMGKLSVPCEMEVLSDEKLLFIITLQDKAWDDIRIRVREVCTELVDVLARYLRLSACCFVGEPVSLTQILEQLEKLQTMDYDNVVFRQAVLPLRQEEWLRREFRYRDYVTDRYLNYQGNYGAVVEEIRHTINQHKKELVLDKAFMDQFRMGFYYILTDFSRQNRVLLGSLVDPAQNAVLLNRAEDSIDDLLAWVDSIQNILKEYYRSGQETESLSDKVKKYIEENIEEEISAEHVAGYVHLTANYLNRIFKKETGVSLNQYVIAQKMERAKWLLHHTDWRIMDVAVAVGYYDYSSFSRGFSRVVGMSPQEWKGRKK